MRLLEIKTSEEEDALIIALELMQDILEDKLEETLTTGKIPQKTTLEWNLLEGDNEPQEHITMYQEQLTTLQTLLHRINPKFYEPPNTNNPPQTEP